MKVSVEDKTIEAIKLDDNERKITSSANSMGILRLQIAKHIGVERMDSFLFQFGWEMGRADGKELLNSDVRPEQLVIDGPIQHIASGQISGIDHRCDIEYNSDGTLKTLVGRGEWFNSYEVEQHLAHFGKSDEPICHTLAGYSSGMMSTIFKKPLIAKEITCVGAGHDNCQWMVRPQEEWGDDVKQNVVELLGRTPIVEELEYTYDNLLDRTEFITNLSDFQKKLTGEVVNGKDLQAIVKMAGEILEQPVTIENLSMETLASEGISETLKDLIQKDKKEIAPEFLVKEHSEYTISARKKVYELESYNRIVVPVLVQKQLLGYCTMITEKRDSDNYEEEYLYLEHLASAAALVMLNEKAVFESLGRMKVNYLDQVLGEEISASELLQRGTYIDVDFTRPYRLVVINYSKNFETLEEKFNFEERMLDLTYQYYRSKGRQVLSGFREDKLVMMIFNPDDINTILDAYIEYIGKYLGDIQFQMGLGSYKSDIESAVKGYEEARIALRLAIRKERVSYDDLGIVGVLINSNNIESIQILAKEQLQGIYDTDDKKNQEMFETLYYFLQNGGNLKNTAADLALSMSGLRHRIQRIEDILQKDLRDPEVSNSLLLIMKAIIVLKGVNIS